MNTVLRLLKNTIYLSVTDVIKPFISIILIIYISRTLGTMGLGEYTAIINFTFFFEIFAKLGLHHLIVRDIAIDRSRSETYFTVSLVIGFICSLIAFLLLFLFLKAMAYPAGIDIGIKILSFSIVFVVLADYWQAILEGLQRMEFKALTSIMDVLIRVILGISVIYLGFGIPGLIWTMVAARAFICLLSLFILIKLGIKLNMKLNIPVCISLLKQTATFLFISIVTTAYWRIDVLILSKMKGAVDTGYYSAAYRIMEVLKGLFYSYIASLFPIIASSFAISKDSFKRRCVLSVKYLFLLTFPIAIGTTILSRNIILLVYGKEFLDSTGVMQILIWTMCLFPIALVFARALVASNNQRFDLLCNVLALVFNVSLNLLLIPRFSYIGSAIATSLSICFFLSLQAFFVTKILFRIEFLKILTKPFLAGCAMGVFTLLLRNTNLFIVISLSAVLYIFLLIKIKTFSMEEINMFKELWRQKASFLTIRG
jgi:O-antigen/teichoic acid export membrane protein